MAKTDSYSVKLEREVFDDKVRPYFDSLRQSFLMNEGKYSFVIKTTGNDIIYVIPNMLGKPNEATMLNIKLEKYNKTIRDKLDELTKQN
jgi:hypothetical protein